MGQFDYVLLDITSKVLPSVFNAIATSLRLSAVSLDSLLSYLSMACSGSRSNRFSITINSWAISIGVMVLCFCV